MPFVEVQPTYSFTFKMKKIKKKENRYFVVYSYDLTGNLSAPAYVSSEVDPGGGPDDEEGPPAPTNVLMP